MSSRGDQIRHYISFIIYYIFNYILYDILCLIWSPRELVVGEHDVVETGGAVDQNSDPFVLGRDLDTSGHLIVDIDSGITSGHRPGFDMEN